ncbi:GTP-dependent dephospho-CoA kinase family protein [Halorubrum sp. Boch-26]|uniref:GTP-dependent dephospho-CoA kinase family protein n=1 Tax=Halorubrum sp. Boch-26 TaxID=2994426 RepID=UPI0024695714|nr:GTP-dependent dephospho-CoA kinase family protein [Halorubrum sp. Boch-26]
MLTLPDSLRDAFKDPLGPVTTDADELLAGAAETRGERVAPDAPIIAVGDVVTYHLREAGRVPHVALIDGKTEREAVDAEIESALAAADDRRVSVENPAASLSAELLAALNEALSAAEPVIIEVTGEEDLAALPAILAAPDGASVVYGQPGEGMVRVPVTPESRAEARELFEALNGDVAAAYDALGVTPDGGR